MMLMTIFCLWLGNVVSMEHGSTYLITTICFYRQIVTFIVRNLRCISRFHPYLDLKTPSTVNTSPLSSTPNLIDYCNLLYCNLQNTQINCFLVNLKLSRSYFRSSTPCSHTFIRVLNLASVLSINSLPLNIRLHDLVTRGVASHLLLIIRGSATNTLLC